MTAADAPFDLLRLPPAPGSQRLVASLVHYRERRPGLLRQRETAPLTVPLILSLGSPFRIALGRDPGPDDAQPSFVAGLFAGPVHIESDGGAASCGPGGGLYIAVTELDALHARAVAAGAPIERPLQDTPYGSREFSCRDPEGRSWSFGTYWPKVQNGSAGTP